MVSFKFCGVGLNRFWNELVMIYQWFSKYSVNTGMGVGGALSPHPWFTQSYLMFIWSIYLVRRKRSATQSKKKVVKNHWIGWSLGSAIQILRISREQMMTFLLCVFPPRPFPRCKRIIGAAPAVTQNPDTQRQNWTLLGCAQLLRNCGKMPPTLVFKITLPCFPLPKPQPCLGLHPFAVDASGLRQAHR